MHGYIELNDDCLLEVTEDNQDSIVIYIACVVPNDDEPYDMRFASSDERDEYCDMMDLEECNGIIDIGKETVWGFGAPKDIDVVYDIAYYSEQIDL